MKYILTPEFLTIVNSDGEEFSLPLHPAEYAQFLIVGIELTYRNHDSSNCVTFDVCFSQQQWGGDMPRFDRMVSDLIRSRRIFITLPSWIERSIGVVTFTYTEKYKAA